MTEPMSLLPAATRIAERRGMKHAPNLDAYGLRAVRADFTSRGDFRWAFPGRWTNAAGPFTTNADACPSQEGDGVCAGLSWRGMASGSIPATTLLLVGWRSKDVLAQDSDKVRVKRAYVVDVLTPTALLAERNADESANLRSADLRSADLRSADLRSADLYGANLGSADLRSADLRSADLRRADLRSADLYGANLYGADHGNWERDSDGFAQRKAATT